MKRCMTVTGLGLMLQVLMGASTARAQERPIEFGSDIGASFLFSGGQTLSTISVPSTTLRVGFWMNERISVEPNVNFTWVHVSGSSLTNFNGALALLYHFTPDPSRTRPFVTVFPGVNHLDFGDLGGSTTQFFAGGGLGALMPLQERLAFRAEALYAHNFSTSDISSSDEVDVRIGISFFTH